MDILWIVHFSCLGVTVVYCFYMLLKFWIHVSSTMTREERLRKREAIVSSIEFKKEDNIEEGSEGIRECCICVKEFQEDETRMNKLVNCNHAFHGPCIDTWLRSNFRCPSCRTFVLPNIPDDAGSHQKQLGDKHIDIAIVDYQFSSEESSTLI